MTPADNPHKPGTGKEPVDWSDRCGLAIVVVGTVILVAALTVALGMFINAWAVRQ